MAGPQDQERNYKWPGEKKPSNVGGKTKEVEGLGRK